MPASLCLIDLGSNALRLAVYEPTGAGLPQCTRFYRERVRLSQGMDAGGGELQPEPMERALAVLREYSDIAKERNCRLVAVATSAVRDAANREEFLEQVAARSGLELWVLDEAAEARFAFYAAAASLPLRCGWVLEIGGGSSQLSVVKDKALDASYSAPLGAVRSMERYPLSDPPETRELTRLRSGLRADLVHFGTPERVGGTLVGISGTVKSLARMHQHRVGRTTDDLHGYRVPLEDLRALTGDLAALSLGHRKAVPGMDPDRADVILAGFVLLELLMGQGRYDELVVCRYGIREGIAWECLRDG